jgi:predicted phage terminase large subunit-like protein
VQSSDILEIALRRGFNKKQTAAALRGLDEEQVTRLAWACRWADTRHDHQIVPEDDPLEGPWSVWLIMGGRGAGKTRVGAEWMGMAAASTGLDANGKAFRGLVAAPTNNDLDGTCFEGESGLLEIIPSSLIADYNINKHRIKLHNGSIIGGISAEKSSRFRGPQWHKAWCDELAAWGDNGRDPQDAWDTMALSVRLGDDTRILATTTPRPLPHIKALLADPGTVVTTASTYVNLDNLSGEFAKRILKYEGTKIGRQEIHAELIDAEEGGIVSRSNLRLWPSGKGFPAFEYIVMSLDTAYSEESRDKKKNETDPSACSVWGGFRHKGVPNIMLLDCWAEKLSFPDLVDRVTAERKQKYGESDKRPLIALPKMVNGKRNPQEIIGVGKKIDVIVIEGKASGKSLRQQLAKDGILTVEYNPGKADKLTRLHVVSPLPVDGRVWIPESLKNPGKFMSWAEPLIEQLCSYSGEGTVLHDDLLDTTAQAWRIIDDQWLHYLDIAIAKKKLKNITDPDAPVSRRPVVNPYDR